MQGPIVRMASYLGDLEDLALIGLALLERASPEEHAQHGQKNQSQ